MEADGTVARRATTTVVAVVTAALALAAGQPLLNLLTLADGDRTLTGLPSTVDGGTRVVSISSRPMVGLEQTLAPGEHVRYAAPIKRGLRQHNPAKTDTLRCTRR